MSLTSMGGLPNRWVVGGDAAPMGWAESKTRTPHGDTYVVLRLDAPLSDEELSALCGRVDTLIRRACGAESSRTLVCDVTALDVVDLGLIDQLARLRLCARRAGGTVVFRHAGSALKGLMALLGLDDLLLGEPEIGAGSVECQRQTEQRKDAGVEKDIEVRHPPL